jgi:hypothetical protein
MSYSIHRVDGRGISLSTMKGGATVRFELRHDADGAVAFTTDEWLVDSATPRQINGLRLQAARQLPRFDDYERRTGGRWEVEQKAKRDAERAAKKRADRIAYLRRTIPLYEAELAELLKGDQ